MLDADDIKTIGQMIGEAIHGEDSPMAKMNEQLEEIRKNTTPQITKEDIMKIRDRTERQRMISQHMDLFQ